MSKAVQALVAIQARIRAPKDQKNAFAGFNYRNAEGILDALKPLLQEQGAAVVLTDTRSTVEGSRVFCDSVATLYAGDGSEVSASAFAEVDGTKKGNDASQRCGSASSYARKYALCGLFAIGTGDDPDADDNRETAPASKPAETRRKPAKMQPAPTEGAKPESQPAGRASAPAGISEARAAYESALMRYSARAGKDLELVRAIQERHKGRTVDQWTDAELADVAGKLDSAGGKVE